MNNENHKTHKTHYVFCQFDTRFLYRDYKETLADQYYAKQWETKQKDGYYKPDQFWELPTWITEIDGVLEKHEYTSELKIISEVADFTMTGYDVNKTVFLFSALDINKQYIKDTAMVNSDYLFIVGGYIDGVEYFGDIMNIEYQNDIQEFCLVENIPFSYEVSYRLFKGLKCIPRLTLSTGCKHNCKFCCVEKDLKEYSSLDIYKQIEAMKVLDFKLVYLNDKTFGQCENYKELKGVDELLHHWNKDFDGFIIQTTAAKCKDAAFCYGLKSLGVKVVEIGVETYNDRLLRKYKKPHNIKMIMQSMENLMRAKLNIIPNILIGLIGETSTTYRYTLGFLKWYSHEYRKAIYSLNVYNLAVYAGTDLANEVNAGTDDSNEMETDKSYHTEADRNNIDYFYSEVFKLGIDILDK